MEEKTQNEINWLSLLQIIKLNSNRDSTELVSQEQKKELWVPDSECDICFNCLSKFGTFFRKHHCRVCGNIFCKDCSDKSIEINVKDVKGMIKTCTFCYVSYQELQKEMNIIINDQIEYQIGDDLDTKLSAYCRRITQEAQNCSIFLETTNAQYEIEYKNAINTTYERLISLLVEYVLVNESNNQILYDNWHKILVQLTIETINLVNPSCRDLDDSMHINEYIKIKCLQYKDQHMCKVINGFALQKNVMNKKMKTLINNPKLLLFNCDLNLNHSNLSVSSNFDNALHLKKPYFEIIKKKIECLKPDVILAKNEIAEEFSSAYSEQISIAMKIKKPSLEKIARCTKTIPLPSLDLIGPKTILGQCKSFHIEKIEQGNIKQLMVNNYNLMIIEGGDQCLYSTILLSGDNMEELKQIKRVMKEKILPTARDLFLQKEILFISNIQKPNISSEISANVFENENINEGNINYIEGFNTSLINNEEILWVKRMTMFRGQARLISNNLTRETLNKENIEDNEISAEHIAESEVLKTIMKKCEKPQEAKALKFYSKIEINDKPFGKLIIDLSNSIGDLCLECNKDYEQHSYYFYNANGRLMLAPILYPQEYQLNDVLSYLNTTRPTPNGWGKRDALDSLTLTNQSEIFTYGYCKECKRIVTPLFKVSKDVFDYSSTKFFKDMFFNHSQNNSSNRQQYNISNFINLTSISSLFLNDKNKPCNHLINKDINRIFITETCSILFSYKDITKYFIIPMNLNSVLGLSLTRDLNKKYLTKALEVSNKIAPLLIADLHFTEDKINNINQTIDQDNIIFFYDILDKITKTSKKVINKIECLQKQSIGKFLSHSDNLTINYVKSIVYIKKIYYKLITYRQICYSLEKLVRKLNKMIKSSMKIDGNNTNQTTQSQGGDMPSSDNIDIKYDSAEIDDQPEYAEMIEFLKYYDNNHKAYACEINENDIASLIANALTSDEYLKSISYKFQLNEIKCERKQVYLDKNIRLEQRKGSRKFSSHLTTKMPSTKFEEIIIQTAKNFEDENEAAFFNTLLLFDQSKQVFSHPKYDSNRILQQLQTELLSEDNCHFEYHMESDPIKLRVNINESEFNSNKQPKAYIDTLHLSRQTSSQSKEKNEQHTHSVLNELSIEKEDTLTSIKDYIENIIKKEINDLKVKRNKNKDPKQTKKNEAKKDKSNKNTGFNLPDVEVIVYYPRKFEAFRITYCATYEEFLESISKSTKWSNVSGGKSKALFYKSFDNKYILKGVTKDEFKMFVDSGSQYFYHKVKYLFHRMPSALAKILGVYKIKKRNKGSRVEKYYIILMENQFFGMEGKEGKIKAYDLKGSKLNRYIQKANQKPNQVLPDTNFQEDFNGEPIALDANLLEVLNSALHNDCLILNKLHVIDYSLLLIINDDESNQETKFIKLGIIDYIRKYTWDKQLEHVGKKIINGMNTPTILNPIKYSQRFLTEIKNYFIGI